MEQLLRVACRHADKAEHFGFVAIAYVDVFELHHLMFIVTVWLAITGVPSFIMDIRRG